MLIDLIVSSTEYRFNPAGLPWSLGAHVANLEPSHYGRD